MLALLLRAARMTQRKSLWNGEHHLDSSSPLAVAGLAPCPVKSPSPQAMAHDPAPELSYPCLVEQRWVRTSGPAAVDASAVDAAAAPVAHNDIAAACDLGGVARVYVVPRFYALAPMNRHSLSPHQHATAAA